MSTTTDHSMGITPIVLRRAAFYLQLGDGVYHPNHPHHDMVRVVTTYDLRASKLCADDRAQGRMVIFYRNGCRVRWVEFSCKIVGAGGESLLTLLPSVTKTEVSNE